MSSSGRESITPIDAPVFTRLSFRSKRRFCYRLLVSPLQDAGYFALSMLKRFEAQAFEALHQELGLTLFCVRNVSRVPNDPSARRLTPNYGAVSPCDGHENRRPTEGDHLWHNSTPLAELGRAPGVREYASEQINQAKNHLNQSMTMEQLLEAEQRAAEWIRKMRKIPPSSSIENPPNASTA